MFNTRYDKLSSLGEGGYATVYKVRDKKYGNLKALRKLNSAVDDPNSKVYKNWERECEIMMYLSSGNHPNIVHYGRPEVKDNVAYVEMDFVKGQEVYAYLESQNFLMPLEEVFHLAEQISSALAFCHYDIYKYCMDRQRDNLKSDPNDAQKLLIDAETEARLIERYQVIHNDIQHRNVMRQFDGRYILIDFGLSIQGEKVSGNSSRHKNGVVEYWPPEKWDDDTILTEQCDIYSFGVLLYLCLAGQLPFYFNSKDFVSKEEANHALYLAHKNTPPAAIRPLREKRYPEASYRETYPDWLEAIIMRCLQKNPKDRYQNGKELHEAILAGLRSMDDTTVLKENHKKELDALCEKHDSEVKNLNQEHERQLKQSVDATVLERTHTYEQKLKNANRAKLWLWLIAAVLALGVGVVSYLYNDSIADYQWLSGLLEERDNKVEVLESENAELEAQLGNHTNTAASQLQEAKNSYKQSQQEVADLRQQVSDLNKQVQDLTNKNNRLAKDLNTARSQKSKAEKEVQSLRKVANL